MDDLEEISKAAVTLPPPGGPIRIALLGQNNPLVEVQDYTKMQQYALYYEMYRQHPWVRAAVDKIADNAVKSGFAFVSEDPEDIIDKDSVKKYKKFFRRSSQRQLLRVTLKDLIIYGEAFWHVEQNLTGAPFRALRLIPRLTRPYRRDANGTPISWKYGYAGNKEDNPIYEDRFILHFKMDDTENDTVGLSKLFSLQKTVASDLNAMEFNGMYFENGAQTGIVFTMESVDAASATRNREYLESTYVGVRNAHRPVLLEGGIKQGRAIASHQEMQFAELRAVNRQEIIGVLGVDPRKLGIPTTGGTTAGSDNVDDDFHSETITALVGVVEEEVDNKLLQSLFNEEKIVFKFSDNDPRQQVKLLQMYGDAIVKGIYIIDEVRGKLGMGPVPGGDVPLIQTPAGILPLPMVTKVAEMLLLKPPPNPTNNLGGDNKVTSPNSPQPTAEPITGLGTNDNPPQSAARGN